MPGRPFDGAQGRRRGIGILSLMVWIFVVWISAGYETVGVATAVSAPAQNNEQLQIEKGRQAVGQACAPCHSNILRIVQIHKKSAEQWRDTVYSMIGRGAQILPEEIEPLTAFLAANAGGGRPSASSPAQASNDRQPASGTPAQQLAEAAGRSLLQRQCARCHDLEAATKKPETDDWKTVIARMVTYGADVSPADQQRLIEYLNGLTK